MAAHKILYFCEAQVEANRLNGESPEIYVSSVFDQWLEADTTGYAIRMKELVVDNFTLYNTADDNKFAESMVFVNDSSYDSFRIMATEWETFAANHGIEYTGETVHKIPALFQNHDHISKYGENTRYVECIVKMMEDTMALNGYAFRD